MVAHEQGDWELRVLADGKMLKQQIVHREGERWKLVSVDLCTFAGRKVSVRSENCANDWHFEFGYWSQIELSLGQQTARARR